MEYIIPEQEQRPVRQVKRNLPGCTVADFTRFLGRIFAAAGERQAFQRYGIAIVLPCIALALTTAFSNISLGPFFPLFSFAVVVAAAYGSTKPGLAAVACSLLLNAIALPPAFSVRVSSPEHLVRLLAFGVVGVLISVLIGTIGNIQRRLDFERQRLEITLRSIGDAVIATDPRGRITFLNPAAENATGWKNHEASGHLLKDVFRIVNEQTRNPAEDPVEKVIRMGGVVGLANHTVLIRKDGTEVPIDDSAAPILNAGVLTGVVLVFRDVTQSRAKEVALLRAEKLASVGRLAATVAHEINNPLEAVTNLLYLIGTSDDISITRTLASAAEQELARASHVSKQTLSFARDSRRPEAVELPHLLDDVIRLYSNKLQSKGVMISKRYRSNIAAMVSQNDVRQVISNLLSNAIDAERTGGRIDVRVSTSAGCGTVRLTVADRGCGIPPEQISRLYEPFFTTKSDVGTGLGLWITKEIVDAHGGRIQVRSRTGRGTVFSIVWPAAEPVEATKSAASQE